MTTKLRSAAVTALCALWVLPSASGAAQDGEQVTSAVAAFDPLPGQAVCRGAQGYAADFGGRQTYLWRPEWVRAMLADRKAAAGIRNAAEQALTHGPYSVTDKLKPIPDADANDYASIGPYWWPDPKKSGGLPYYRRDGEVNPERSGPEFDKARLVALSNDLQALALAYTDTGDERFALHAASMLRGWFITPETRMNPNFNFAQGIPGRVNGRGEGIIEASDLSEIIEAVGLLRPSPALSDTEHQAIQSWYRDFAVWMATSDNGGDEMRKTNNHGVFYDFYLAHFALYAGLGSVTANIVDAFPAQRIAVQMDRQGRFLAELKRTRSWHYSHFIVGGAAKLATIAECSNKDLWNHKLPDGRGLMLAETFLKKYRDKPQSWPFKDTDKDKGSTEKMTRTAFDVRILFSRSETDGPIGQLP